MLQTLLLHQLARAQLKTPQGQPRRPLPRLRLPLQPARWVAVTDRAPRKPRLRPNLGYPNLAIRFDLSNIEVLRKNENSRETRETQLLDRGVLTINEVRRSRNLPEVPWGTPPAANPGPD